MINRHIAIIFAIARTLWVSFSTGSEEEYDSSNIVDVQFTKQ